ncbi:hypothetical protein ACOSQ3_016732 [Xanthoceras sorbifolium]
MVSIACSASENNMGMENCRGLIFACCMLFLALFAAGQNVPTSKDKGNCTYAVTIETTCPEGAETSSPVSLRFGDADSNEILVRRLNTNYVRKVDPTSPAVPFQACNEDEFQVTGPCVKSQICYLYLKLVGADDWRPGSAKVRAIEAYHHSSKNFSFRRDMPRRSWYGLDMCVKEVTPFGEKQISKNFD